MAQWSVKPEWKKSVIERNYLRKGDNVVMVETGWRWGEFVVYTDDDNPPNIEAGVDMFDCGYESEMIETFDGCWEEVDYDDCDDETREWLEEFFEENSWLDLEEEGWLQDECEMIIDCDLIIERLDDDGNPTGEIVGADDEEETIEESEPVKLEAQAKWPFDNATQPTTENAQFKCESCDFSTEDIMELVDSDDESKGAYMCPECGGKVNLE